MAGYTKADFYAGYRAIAVHPQYGYCFNNFRSPSLFDGQPITCVLHYHPCCIKPNKQRIASKIADQIEPSDVIAVIGGAFNWLGEAIEDQTGCTSYCVDPSDWIHEDKNNSPDADLISAIEAQGYVINEGIGEYLFNLYTDPNPRSRNPERIVSAYLDLPVTPTKLITDECWQILDEPTKLFYTSLNIPLIHVIDGEVV